MSYLASIISLHHYDLESSPANIGLVDHEPCEAASMSNFKQLQLLNRALEVSRRGILRISSINADRTSIDRKSEAAADLNDVEPRIGLATV